MEFNPFLDSNRSKISFNFIFFIFRFLSCNEKDNKTNSYIFRRFKINLKIDNISKFQLNEDLKKGTITVN